MSFVIESGIEIPKATSRRGKESKYNFGALEVKQSFFVPNSSTISGEAVKSLKASAYAFEKKNETKRFSVFPAATVKGNHVVDYEALISLEELPDETVLGARVFRTE